MGQKLGALPPFLGGGAGSNWTTRGYANSRIANLRTGHLVDRSTVAQKGKGCVYNTGNLFLYFPSVPIILSVPVLQYGHPVLNSNPNTNSNFNQLFQTVTLIIQRAQQ